MKFYIQPLALMSLIILASCTSLTPSPQAPLNEHLSLQTRKNKTNTVKAWEIRGAMAAKHNNKGWSATMNWLQNGANNYQLRLIGPLGGGSVSISKHGSMITYQDGPKKLSSTNASQLLQEQTGIRLPVNNLYFWVRGLPAPGAVQNASHDSYNHLTKLMQNGYTITYSRYTSANGVDLPSKLRLQGHGVTIKVVVKQWRIF